MRGAQPHASCWQYFPKMMSFLYFILNYYCVRGEIFIGWQWHNTGCEHSDSWKQWSEVLCPRLHDHTKKKKNTKNKKPTARFCSLQMEITSFLNLKHVWRWIYFFKYWDSFQFPAQRFDTVRKKNGGCVKIHKYIPNNLSGLAKQTTEWCQMGGGIKKMKTKVTIKALKEIPHGFGVLKYFYAIFFCLF